MDRNIPIPAPIGCQLFVLETQVLEYGNRRVLKFCSLGLVCKLRHLFDEQFTLTSSELVELVLSFGHLSLLSRVDFLLDAGKSFLLGIPSGVSQRVVIRQPLNIIDGLDVLELGGV